MIFRKKENISTLDDVLESSWKLLHDGVRNFKNPFHHATLTTLDDNKPQVRIVIVREFSEKDRTLICHCDVRSPKVLEITDNPNVSWLFYDPKKWLQLRLSGTASVHTDDNTAEAQWEKVRIHHRINYCAEIPPGSPSNSPPPVSRIFFGIKGPNYSTVQRPAKTSLPSSADLMKWTGFC